MSSRSLVENGIRSHTSPVYLNMNDDDDESKEDEKRRRSQSDAQHRRLLTPFLSSPNVGAPIVKTKSKESSGATGVFFTLLMSIVGAGIFSIPSAVHLAGTVTGCVLIAITGFVMTYTAELLLRSRVSLTHSSIECTSIEQLVLITSGRRWSLFFNMATATAILGGCVSYVVLVKELVPGVLQIDGLHPLHSISPNGWTVIVFMCVVLPICLLKSIGSLRFSSYVGFLLTLYVVGLALEEAFNDENTTSLKLRTVPETFGDFTVASGIVNFSFVLHVNVLPLFQEVLKHHKGDMKRAESSMTWIVRGVVIFVISLYIMFGLCGVAIYGDDIDGNILNNFSTKIRFQVARVMAVLVVMTSFPLLFYPLRSILQSLTRRTSRYLCQYEIMSRDPNFFAHAVFTVCLLSLVVLLALKIPGIQYVFSLTGSTAVVALCYLFPVLVFVKRFVLNSKLHKSSIASSNDLPLLMEDGLTENKNDDDDDSHVTPLGYLDYVIIPAVLLVTPVLGIASFIYTVNDLV